MDFLCEKLNKEYGCELTNKIIEGYSKKRVTTFRVNNLKADRNIVKEELESLGFILKDVSFYKEAFILVNGSEKDLERLDIYEKGCIYLQSLSSMLPVLYLEPKSRENILDMAAAPGGKTTQIASVSNGEAFITACEKNKIRAERLKYNILKQSAPRVSVLVTDARKLDPYFTFDKILLDAPCSGSGTIYQDTSIVTNELVDRSVNVQRDLLKKALSLLKKNQEMIYSTCSILKEENEKQLEYFLKNGIIEIIPLDTSMLEDVFLLPSNIEGTVLVGPNQFYEGFFIAKIKKIK